ncbi:MULTISPECIES: MFS transporter [Microbacterium]|uniref:MFS transporter n=1 Tax=Microbacterium TaxID=33882 RepID=UPI00217DA0F7|nr:MULTISPECIES: MFS transporter [Microbacterium]UWF78419.1 MFS transporter [Microbacterium neungamense]WCM56594.1 MFS transporter [Microbacterium sp. EF45047]
MTAPSDTGRFPLGRLVLLAAAGFLTMLTETIPAGLLPAIGRSLDAGDAATGQLLTAYAGASMLAAIPLVAATGRAPRKTLIIATITGVAVANLITALSPVFWLAFAARVLGGAAAALQWAILAGYAMRLVGRNRQGRALSLAMGGIPLALAAAGTRVLPTVPPTGAPSRSPWTALRVPGIAALLIGAGAFQLGHMNLYTYLAPYLTARGDPLPVSAFLLTVGVAAIAGLFLTGVVIDRHLRLVALTAMAAFTIGMLLLAITDTPAIMAVAAIIWGLGLGASPTVFQPLSARCPTPLSEIGRSMRASYSVVVTGRLLPTCFTTSQGTT